jgi:beta-galactosidase
MIYITSRRFSERTNSVTDVKIYSNTKSAELFVNGHSQGKPGAGADGIYIWKNVTLSPGENKITASTMSTGQSISDECVWIFSPPQP